MTVTAVDDEGTIATDDDDETVTGEDVAPSILIVKTGEGTINEGGDTATYTFTITNTSASTDPLTVTALSDDKFGDLLAEAEAQNGGSPIVLASGASFMFTIDRTVTLDGGESHTNIVTVTAVDDEGTIATDTDDETVTGDDIPQIGALSIAIDEDFLPTGNQDLPAPSPGDDGGTATFAGNLPIDYGADSAGATVSFAGLHGTQVIDTSFAAVLTSATNAALFYFWDGSTSTLYAATDITDELTAAATAAFMLTVTDPTTGAFTFSLLQALEHGPGSGLTDDTEDPNIEVALGYVAIDGDDGDTSPGTLNVVIDDDIPRPIYPDWNVLTQKTSPTDPNVSSTVELDLDTNIDDNMGADGGTVRFDPSLHDTSSGLTSAGQNIQYFLNDHDSDAATPDRLEGWVGDFGTGTKIFEITLNPDGSLGTSSDTYTVTLFGLVDGGASVVNFDPDAGFDFTGGNRSWVGFFTGTDDDSQDLLLTPIRNGVNFGTVNTTADAGGVNNAFVGENSNLPEALRVDFVTDVRQDSGVIGDLSDDDHTVGFGESGADYSDVANRDHNFDGHYIANGAFATFQINSGTTKLQITARDDFDTNTIVGDGTLDSITAISINFDGEIETFTFADIGTTATTRTVGQPNATPDKSLTVQFVDVDPGAGVFYGVTIEGDIDDIQVATFTADGYSSLEYLWVDGTQFQIGQFGATTIDPGAPTSFEVPLQVVDTDGDVVDAEIGITLAPSSTGTIQDFSASGTGETPTSTALQPNIVGSDFGDTITGDGANNILYGNGGNDTIIGGGGRDTLIGGEGDDIFDFNALSDSPSLIAADTILDFEEELASEVIDLQDIFGGVLLFGGNDTATLANTVTWSFDGTYTIVRADTTGDTTADFVLKLSGSHSLQAGDFIL